MRTLLLIAALLVPLAAAAQSPSGDRLPGANRVMDPVRRGADGKIEKFDPTKEGGPRGSCSQGTICVGAGLTYATLARGLSVARDGDTVELMPGVYHETVAIDHSKVTLRGIGHVHVDCAGLRPIKDKACILLAGDNVTLDNIEISGAEIDEAAGANAACIRNEPNRSFTLRRVVCHDSQNGLLTDGGSVVIESSEFYENSWTGFTHNVYLSGNCPSVTVRGSTFRDARVAHEFKSRCAKTTISDSTFRNTKGSRALDLPDGGDVLISGGIIEQKTGVQNPEVIAFAAESCRFPGTMRILRTQIVARHPQAAIHNFDKCQGQPIVLDGVVFEGPRPKLVGYVLEH
jgi:Right handed beta helix region